MFHHHIKSLIECLLMNVDLPHHPSEYRFEAAVQNQTKIKNLRLFPVFYRMCFLNLRKLSSKFLCFLEVIYDLGLYQSLVCYVISNKVSQ